MPSLPNMSTIDTKLVVVGVAATAAVGIATYALYLRRQRQKMLAGLKAIDFGGQNWYEAPGTTIYVSEDHILRLEETNNFEIRSDDIWVITYPKCGTTWTQEIVWLVCNNADRETANTVELDTRFPFFEYPFSNRRPAIKKMPSPRLIKTHLALPVLPHQIREKKPKIIYTMRNPKDTCVSMYHFLKMLTLFNYKGNFEEFAKEFFMDIVVGHGSFWDHHLDYWRLRDEPNMLLLKYEDMITDLNKEVKRIAAFLDKELTEEQVQTIVEHCTFKTMKNNSASNQSHLQNIGFTRAGMGDFMRKGKIGDWKNYFTPELNDMVDQLNKKWLEPEGLTFDYE
ncbi:PREDICTED: amine sulfotransferase-like [Priapulus caudatus]|uniref:Amine sulfotransferase-like n=1 Tax=Priapulus caudatus TaxID=37621 RepID=A0ABM1F9V3_PRICU|nr:PREDICTED: amine sulfotransferase-like [Priapulus caudatus]XP_014681223.1 PREDICTED: amine sulfotransferase-like [Priapulus caudatus]XP_014681224.1 PREDICTED: amine sulfotransferase-like [Priapulus caudatus]